MNIMLRLVYGAFMLSLALSGAVHTSEALSDQRVAFITPWTDLESEAPLWETLSKLGWVKGKNLSVERRQMGEDVDEARVIASQLLQKKPNVFIVPTAAVAARVREVTDKVPIVTVTAGDLVAAGLATHLARPGGNVTGVQVLQVELAAKRLALLKETVPSLTRVTLLGQFPKTERSEGAYNQIYTQALREYEGAARTLRIALSTKTIRTAVELSEVFTSMRDEHTQAVIVFGNVFSYRNRAQISDMALKFNLPTMCEFAQWVQAGALMAYYPPSDELFRLTAGIVDQILRGAAPGDVPIQQPTTFALSLNLKTAKALGITIPESILLRADEVIR